MDNKQIEQITELVLKALGDTVAVSNNKEIPVGISARHVHLTQEHVEILYGKGHQLTKIKELMGGQFASEERLTIVSSKMKIIENLRVLGPVRKESQVEISATDSLKLGVKVPLRNSGDIAGTTPLTLIGPCGSVSLKEGCIVAARHVHMSPNDAKNFGVTDKQMISVKFPGERSTIMENVLVRVDPSFTLEMHIDTDEANAVYAGKTALLVK